MVDADTEMTFDCAPRLVLEIYSATKKLQRYFFGSMSLQCRRGRTLICAGHVRVERTSQTVQTAPSIHRSPGGVCSVNSYRRFCNDVRERPRLRIAGVGQRWSASPRLASAPSRKRRKGRVGMRDHTGYSMGIHENRSRLPALGDLQTAPPRMKRAEHHSAPNDGCADGSRITSPRTFRWRGLACNEGGNPSSTASPTLHPSLTRIDSLG